MTAGLWHAVFGNDHPIEIEIGPGRGDVLLAFAAASPAKNFYGIEIRRTQTDAINARAASLGLRNVFVVAGDARCIAEHLIPPGSVHAFHVYFPDPWPKTRHRERRFFRPGVPDALARALEPDGELHFATDLSWLFEDGCRALERSGYVPLADEVLRARPITKFERKYSGGRTFARAYRPPPQADAGSPNPQKTS